MPTPQDSKRPSSTPVIDNTPPPMPVFQWLLTSQLEVDHEYQHRPYQNATEELNKHFVPDLCGPILVNTRVDGRPFIIDGQTRHGVHIIRGLRWILAEVKEGLSQAEEAAAYLIKAKNTQRQPIDWFRAGVVAKNPEYMLIQSILAERKIVVQDFATERKGLPEGMNASVTCVRTLQRLVKLDQSGDDLREGLDLILDTWEYAEGALGGQFIEMVTRFLKQYGDKPEFQRSVFIEKLEAYTPGDLREMGTQLRSATTPRPILRIAMQRKILEIYNVGRVKKLA